MKHDVQKIGIVIPAYNAGERLHDVLLKIQKYVPRNRICVIDDGSTDNTATIARGFEIVVLQHETNKGKGAALVTGFTWAAQENLNGVITLDSDGQHDPDHIPEFISVMNKNGCDIVLGRRRFLIGEMPLDRIFSNVLSSLIVSWVCGKRIPDSQCGYRLISYPVLKNIRLESACYEAESELLIKAARNGYKIAHCPIPVQYNNSTSHIRRFRDTIRFCRLILRLIRKR